MMMNALLRDDNIATAAVDAAVRAVVAKRGLERRQQAERWFS